MSVYKKYIFLLTYFFLFPVSSYSYGLRFKGSNYPIDKRTSYRVFDKKVPVYNDYFDVQFDMALYPAVEIGYIVDIRGDYNEQAFNLFFDIRNRVDAQFCQIVGCYLFFICFDQHDDLL